MNNTKQHLTQGAVLWYNISRHNVVLTIYVSRKNYHNCGGIKLKNISKIILITAAAASMTSCSIGGKSSEGSSDKKTDTQNTECLSADYFG